jgi:hypothetical protein
MKTLLLLCFFSIGGFAQTKTTVELDKKYEGLSLYFYKNTLKMLNQKDDKDFDELIKDIEKMRFVMVNTAKEKFEKKDYVQLKKNYQTESYEEVMTGRFDGRNFDVLVREVNGSVKGTIILASDSASSGDDDKKRKREEKWREYEEEEKEGDGKKKAKKKEN